MKSTGLVRKIDDSGRLVIPEELRNLLKINIGDGVEIYADDEGKIILKKQQPICFSAKGLVRN